MRSIIDHQFRQVTQVPIALNTSPMQLIQVYCPQNIFTVHIKYLQHNIHTIVQVQYLQCRVLSTNSNSKVFTNLSVFQLHCYLLVIRVKLVFRHVWIPIVNATYFRQVWSCLVINCNICLDLDYCMVDQQKIKENIKSFKLETCLKIALMIEIKFIIYFTTIMIPHQYCEQVIYTIDLERDNSYDYWLQLSFETPVLKVNFRWHPSKSQIMPDDVIPLFRN